MRRTSWIILVALVLFILGGAILWTASKSAPPPFLTTHAPAFDTLLRADSLIQDMDLIRSTNELPTYLATNAAALSSLRLALNQPFEAPPAAYDPAVMMNSSPFKSLAILLQGEGLYFKFQDEPADAARSYIDIIRLGQKIENGPLIFLLIGVSIERIGVEALDKIEPNIPSPTRAEIAKALREINSQRVPFTAVEERERYVRRRRSPTPFHFLFFSHLSRSALLKAEGNYDVTVNSLEVLAVKLTGPDASGK